MVTDRFIPRREKGVIDAMNTDAKAGGCRCLTAMRTAADVAIVDAARPYGWKIPVVPVNVQK